MSVKIRKFTFISLFVLVLVFPSSALAQIQGGEAAPEEKHEGVVTRIDEEKDVEISEGVTQPMQKVEVEITDKGMNKNKVIAEMGGIVVSNDVQKVNVGDKVILSHLQNTSGSESYYVTGFVRRTPIYVLAILFMVAVIGIGGFRGLTSLVGLLVSFVVLIKYIIPNIVSGGNPVTVAIFGSLIILITTLYLAHGISRKTTAAVLGTSISLIITSILAYLFVSFARLSGFGSEEASFLSMFPGMQINLQGILLAGIIIGALGVLDDITVSQSACVFELRNANKNLSWGELYKRGLRIGRDHIASVVNTLVLAYAGASLPLLLLFALSGGEPVSQLINREMIANEIVRTLVGSLGLVSAVPITTALAASLSNVKSY